MSLLLELIRYATGKNYTITLFDKFSTVCPVPQLPLFCNNFGLISYTAFVIMKWCDLAVLDIDHNVPLSLDSQKMI